MLETERLTIRPLALADLDAVHHLMDEDLREADFGSENAQSLAQRRHWLEWTVRNYRELEKLYQPPYGERAIALRATGQLIGLVGFVPCLMPFEQLPGFSAGEPTANRLLTPEFGLFYAVAPASQRQGYASEAARAMMLFAFKQLRLKRVVATTSYDNEGSMGVMRRLGMRLERNPFAEPPWMQVVGIRDNPEAG